jgi:hypothetical protein
MLLHGNNRTKLKPLFNPNNFVESFPSFLNQSFTYYYKFSFNRRLGPRIAGPAGPSRLNVKLLLLLPAGLGSLRVPVW